MILIFHFIPVRFTFPVVLDEGPIWLESGPTHKSHLLTAGLSSSPIFKGKKTLFLGWPNSYTSQRTLLVCEGSQRSHSFHVGKTMFEPLTTQSNAPSGKDHTFIQDLGTHHHEILHTKGKRPQAKLEFLSLQENPCIVPDRGDRRVFSTHRGNLSSVGKPDQ